MALILVDGDGENSIAVAGGANAALTPVAVRRALKRLALGPGDVVLVGHEIPTGPPTRRSASAGSPARRRSSIRRRRPAWPRPRCDSPTSSRPNRGRARVARRAAGKPAAAAQVAAGRRRQRAALVSLGADGARLVTAGAVDARIRAPHGRGRRHGRRRATRSTARSPRVSPPGCRLADAARRAVVAASLAVTQAGAREGMPTPPSSRPRSRASG